MVYFRTQEKFIVCKALFARKTSVGLRTPFYGKKYNYHTIK